MPGAARHLRQPARRRVAAREHRRHLLRPGRQEALEARRPDPRRRRTWRAASPIDRIVPLDDFDLEKASALREHLRMPGMGETTTRHFRDKLAMRVKAQDDGLPVPAFVHVLNDDRHPRVLPTRAAAVVPEAAASGRRDRHSQDQRRRRAVGGDRGARRRALVLPARRVRRRRRLSRRFDRLRARGAGGDAEPVRHAAVRRVALGRRVHDAAASIATSPEARELLVAQRACCWRRSAWCAACRTPNTSAAPTDGSCFSRRRRASAARTSRSWSKRRPGFNMWAEWAKIEIAGGKAPVRAAARCERDYAGLIVSLARQEAPDLSAYTDPEIVWRLEKPHHAGLIVRSPRRPNASKSCWRTMRRGSARTSWRRCRPRRRRSTRS